MRSPSDTFTVPSRNGALPENAGETVAASNGVDRVIAFLVGALAGLQPILLPLNVAVVDVFLLYLFLVWISNLPRLRQSTMSTLSGAVPWLWLVAIGSVIGMFSAVQWGTSALQFARDFYAFGVFFAVLAWLILKPSTWSAMVKGTLVMAGICAVATFLESDLRPAGTFLNPNYAGHFMAMAVVLAAAASRRIGARWLLLIPLLVGGVLRTASFGGLVMLAGGVCVLIWVGAQRLKPGPRLLLRSLLIAVTAFVVLSGTVVDALQSNEATKTGLGENRLDRSSSARWDRWEIGLQLAVEHPFGVGPGGALYEDAALGDHELHNDALAYLVERSSIGLLGLVGYVAFLWRRFPRGGAARVVLGIVLAGSLVRETLNYRHVWIVLALALVMDWQRRDFDASSAQSASLSSEERDSDS